MVHKPLLSLMFFLLCLVPMVAQDANAPFQAETQTYTKVATLGRGYLTNASWWADGRGVLVNSELGAWLYKPDLTLLHHFEGVRNAALSPSGRFLVAAKPNPDQLVIWDTATFEVQKTMDITGIYWPAVDERVWAGDRYIRWPGVNALIWSPDESQIAISVDKQLQIFETRSGQNSLSLPFETPIVSLAWRQDGKQMAVGRYGALDMITMPEGRVVMTMPFRGHPEGLWSPDQQSFATLEKSLYGRGGPLDNALKIWSADGRTLKLVIQAPHSGVLAWSPDSRYIAADYVDVSYTIRHTIYFWDVQTGETSMMLPLGEISKRFYTLDWSPDGTQLMTTSRDNAVRIFDWPLDYDDVPSELLDYQGAITGLAWNADGTQLVSSSEDSSIHIWNVATEESITRFQSSGAKAQGISWNTETGQIAFGTEGSYFYDWNPLTGEKGNSNNPHGRDVDSEMAEGVTLVAYSPDGRLMASAGGDNRIGLWHGEDLRWISFTEGYTPTTIRSLAWSGDSRFVAYTGGPAHVLDVEGGTIRTFECERFGSADFVASVALSKDGRYLAVANLRSGICLWDIETREQVGSIDVQATDLAWSPDGSRLALISPRPMMQMNSQDREWVVEVWSVPDARRLASMTTPVQATDIAWSPDGTRLAAGDSEGLIHIWQQD